MGRLINPVQNVRRPKNPPARERRLFPGETERIIAATGSQAIGNVICFAIETGMRRKEIAQMKWADVEMEEEILRIPDTKTDPRTIPLSTKALRILSSLPRGIDEKVWGYDEKGLGITRVFQEALYFDEMMNHRIGQWHLLFPTSSYSNIVISVTGIGAAKLFSALITNLIPDLHLHGNGQCFPLYYYEEAEVSEKTLIGRMLTENSQNPDQPGESRYIRRETITDWALGSFQKHYRDKSIGKEDIFYYVYGLLHSPEYRSRYENDLRKMLPRIPFASDFWRFSKAGRELSHWHLNYETVDPYPLEEQMDENNISRMTPEEFYRVEEMKFAKSGKEKDKTTILYNSRITLSGIPLETYDYVVNGKSALEWVMEPICGDGGEGQWHQKQPEHLVR